MEYRAISADGHVNEPPTLWTERLPDKFKERGPHVIETRKTKGHAWIMEGQKRPSPMGFSSMYFRSGKRFDRASLIDSFKQIKDRGVRYEDVFPGSYDPAARVKEIIEDETDAEVIFNGVGDGMERDQAVPGQGAQPGVLQGLQRLDRRVPGLCPRALRLQRHLAHDGPRGLPRRARADRRPRPAHGPARVLPERLLLRAHARGRPLLGRRGGDGHADQRPHPVLLPGRRPGFQDHRRKVSPNSESEPRTSASTWRRAASRSSWPR